MIIDFAKVDVTEQPLLILQNLDDTPIGTLKSAFNVEVELSYNEISTLSFDLPAWVDGKKTPFYDLVVGMRIINLKNYGRFVLLNPKIVNDGVKEIKSCTAQSLEYELTKKKFVLEEGTYNLWNPISPNSTILGMILDLMPSWGIGMVDSSLIDKYRTFDSSGDKNIYNFMKSDLQDSYGCVFDFDTYERQIYVRDITNEPAIAPVVFSLTNLIKEVEITEDAEGIVTSLNIYGADGVDIRSVNPMGTTNIINLDYFMTTDNFSQSMITKYYRWKNTFEAYQRRYYNLTIDEALKTSQLVNANAVLTTLNGELRSLENIQAVTIQAIAQELKTQDDLDAANSNIAAKKIEIINKENEISQIQSDLEAVAESMKQINQICDIKSFFTDAEYKIIDRYIKEDSLTEDSFVSIDVDTFASVGETKQLNGTIFNISNSHIELTEDESQKKTYSITGGVFECAMNGFALTANIVKASLSCGVGSSENYNVLFTANLADGTVNNELFSSASLSVNGVGTNIVESGFENVEVEERKIYNIIHEMYVNAKSWKAASSEERERLSNRNLELGIMLGDYGITAIRGEYGDQDGFWYVDFVGGQKLFDKYEKYTRDEYLIDDEVISSIIKSGTGISFKTVSGDLYFTRSTTAYEKRSVEWDLFDYGKEIMDRIAHPSYSCELDIANFLAMSDYVSYKNGLKLGEKLYWVRDDGNVLSPYLVSVKIPFENLDGFVVGLSSKYYESSLEFDYNDFTDSFTSAGKTIDTGKWTYSQFANSGAKTSIDTFMKSALDLAKNSIMSTSGQAIDIGESGIRLRKFIDGSTTQYEPYQLWMNNGQIMFTTDGWATANLAIGQTKTENGIESGVIADNLIGKFVAGKSCIFESEKHDGSTAVFRVDGDGAKLYNAVFDVYNGKGTHITINPNVGFAIGNDPLYTDNAYTINETNARFWVDMNGNVHIKGTLEGCDGKFSGELVAANGRFTGIVQAADFQDLTGRSMLTKGTDGYDKFISDYLDLKGLTISNGSKTTFSVDSQGNVFINGNVTMGSGSTINWNTVSQTGTNPQITTVKNDIDKRLLAFDSDIDDLQSNVDSLWNYTWSKSEIQSIANTQITSNLIAAPNIKGAYIQGGTINGARFLFADYGVMYAGYGSDGKNQTDLAIIESTKGIRIKASEGLGLTAGNGVWIDGNVSVKVSGSWVSIESLVDRIEKLEGE